MRVLRHVRRYGATPRPVLTARMLLPGTGGHPYRSAAILACVLSATRCAVLASRMLLRCAGTETAYGAPACVCTVRYGPSELAAIFGGAHVYIGGGTDVYIGGGACAGRKGVRQGGDGGLWGAVQVGWPICLRISCT